MKPPAKLLSPAPAQSAKAAGLRYVSDEMPGIYRRRAGRGFYYVDAGGEKIQDAAILKRIEALVIPPAWKDVWICPDPAGHLQATGRDERGRKQHKYHPDWQTVRDEAKFGRMTAFAKALPHIRRTTARHLKLPGLPREKVLATVVRLMERTFIRVGNDEYARTNRHFGLTTLRDRHANIHGAQVHFEFKGKSGVNRVVDLEDRRLARIIRNCQELPGYDLFQYVDEETGRHAVTSEDVNDYLREVAGEGFTAKDFRTWAGSLLAIEALREAPTSGSTTEAKRTIRQVIKRVAGRLGNTVAVCRKCYIHPRILELYLQGELEPSLKKADQSCNGLKRSGLHVSEAVMVRLLESSSLSNGKRSPRMRET